MDFVGLINSKRSYTLKKKIYIENENYFAYE